MELTYAIIATVLVILLILFLTAVWDWRVYGTYTTLWETFVTILKMAGFVVGFFAAIGLFMFLLWGFMEAVWVPVLN